MKLAVIKPLSAMIASLVMCLAFSLTLPSKGEQGFAQVDNSSSSEHHHTAECDNKSTQFLYKL